ncbi:Hypothetical predicted protein, partial [Olea europaea subsp. europaea]
KVVGDGALKRAIEAQLTSIDAPFRLSSVILEGLINKGSGCSLVTRIGHAKDYPANSNFHVHKSSERCDLLELVDGELCVGNVPLLTEIPSNVTFKVSLQYAISLMLPLHCLSTSNRRLSKEDFLDSIRRCLLTDEQIHLGNLVKRIFSAVSGSKHGGLSTQWVGNSA